MLRDSPWGPGRAARPLSILLALAPALLVGCASSDAGSMSPSRTPGQQLDLARGGRLYDRHCAVCHGRSGDAKAEIAPLLSPAPRAFRPASFKLASTDNGVPSANDLVRTLRRGMPGSSMVSFGWMPDGNLRQLASYVHHLAVDNLVHALRDEAETHGRPLTAEQALATATAKLTPGATLETGLPVEPDRAALDQGRSLYLRHCAACHGPEGKGRHPHPDWAAHDEFHWARDFTSGILRGGASHRELAWRIRAGMSGVHMPPTTLSDAETGALVAYVRSLIPAAVEHRHLQPREQLRAQRVTDSLPVTPDDPRWAGVEGRRLPLAPLWWRNDAVFEACLKAVHDGEQLALLLSWPDDTRNDRALTDSPHGDAVALQFSSEPDPPLFAMGANHEPVDIWHWKSYRFRDVAGVLDLLESPHAADVPAYIPAAGVTSPSRRADSREARGFRSASTWADQGPRIDATPQWRDGWWHVVLTRPLHSKGERGITLLPGDTLFVAFAVWDGAAGDHGASKSITPWHTLTIDP